MNNRPDQFSFTGAGGHQLAARLDLPPSAPRAFAVFAHCFTCSKDVAAASRISRGLAAAGYAVLRFDFTGLGSSDGEFANTDFTSNVGDIVRAADALREQHAAPSLLIGHSLGGAAVLAAAPAIPEVKAIATIGAPFDPGHITHLFPPEALADLDRHGQADVTLAGRAFRVGSQLLEDANAQNLTDTLQGLGRALMVFHAPRDEYVDVDNARRIFDAAKHPKSFVSLDDADHLLTRREDAAYVADVLAAWAGRYVPTNGSATPTALSGDASRVDRDGTDGKHVDEGTVIITDRGPGNLTQTVQAGRHSLVADEPPGIGSDLGPTPYDLLLAGLGTCTTMTVRMYADRKEWPLEQISVRLRHERTHSDDCRDTETTPCRIDHIQRTVTLTGALTDEQRARLLDIAERCPVHRTLTGDLRITTELG